MCLSLCPTFFYYLSFNSILVLLSFSISFFLSFSLFSLLFSCLSLYFAWFSILGTACNVGLCLGNLCEGGHPCQRSVTSPITDPLTSQWLSLTKTKTRGCEQYLGRKKIPNLVYSVVFCALGSCIPTFNKTLIRKPPRLLWPGFFPLHSGWYMLKFLVLPGVP